MADIVGKPVRVIIDITLRLDESELRALDAIAGYSTDDFLVVFYEKMGRSYLSPHEAGPRSLFDAIKKAAPALLANVDEARKVLDREGAKNAK